jgi:hypothetical protein
MSYTLAAENKKRHMSCHKKIEPDVIVIRFSFLMSIQGMGDTNFSRLQKHYSDTSKL